MDPTRSSIYLLKPPTFLTHLKNLRQNLSLTLQPKLCLTKPNFLTNNKKNMLPNWKKWSSRDEKNTKNQIRLEMNWLVSYERNSDYQSIPRWSKKQIQLFHKTSLNKRIIFLHLPHYLNNDLRRWVSTTELAEILNNPSRILKQKFKWNLIS